MKNRFNIDFFEFSFLVEACITPAPIARSTFFRDAIDKYYKVLTKDERKKLFDWIQLSSKFKYGIERNDTTCFQFIARYDPDNQYFITTNYKDKIETHECFLYLSKYWITTDTSIGEVHISDIKQIKD